MSIEARVSHYRAGWNHTHRRGSIVLVTDTRGEAVLDNLMPDEWLALVDLLRNERPIFWDAPTQTLYTRNEIVGEEEMD